MSASSRVLLPLVTASAGWCGTATFLCEQGSASLQISHPNQVTASFKTLDYGCNGPAGPLFLPALDRLRFTVIAAGAIAGNGWACIGGIPCEPMNLPMGYTWLGIDMTFLPTGAMAEGAFLARKVGLDGITLYTVPLAGTYVRQYAQERQRIDFYFPEPSAQQQAHVPEPATWVLVLAAGLCFCVRLALKTKENL